MKISQHIFHCVTLIVICIAGTSISIQAQSDQQAYLNIGDLAPPLRVSTWIKGIPVEQFEKGRVYVLDFWATWCKPCVAAMPGLSVLARKYRDHVTTIAIDVYENKTTTTEKVKAFVDSMDRQMEFQVAVQDNNEMKRWIDDFGEKQKGIPRTFVVNEEGKVAWIGHPKDLEGVLPEIVNGTWNIKKAIADRQRNQYLEWLNAEAYYELVAFRGDPLSSKDLGQPDSVLSVIERFVRKEPAIKYAPTIAYYTFSALLVTNPDKAYQYGKTAIQTPTYQEPAYDNIIASIDFFSDRLKLPDQIFLLGAEAYQMQLDDAIYPELVNTARLYYKMAEWYWRGGARSKAIDAQQKALAALKRKKNVSETDVAAFSARLKAYQSE